MIRISNGDHFFFKWTNLHFHLKLNYNPSRNNTKIAQEGFVWNIYFQYRNNIESIQNQGYVYNWCIWFWTQQVRHGSLTRQSSHRSSYKVHRRHRSVSSSIPPFLLLFFLRFRIVYFWTLTHLVFVTLATNYDQIRIFVRLLL